MGKKISTISLSVLLLFIAIQFLRPKFSNPPITSDIQAPAEVKLILRRSCYNCHSNESALSWFDKIVPVYWQVKDHITEGRKGLNFSEWDSLSPGDRNAKLWEAVNQVIAGAMPLAEYTLVHPSAKISSLDLQVLKNYVENLIVVQATDSMKTATLNDQFRQAVRFGKLESLPTALNGIGYIPDYKNWQFVGLSDRFDNGTLRVIVGNDIAVRAIRENNTNPWPNGSILGKITWDALRDSACNLQTGAFKQIEYMIRDRKKYSSTLGWGFARFKTPDMIPYGKTALFTSECVNCHRPMGKNDYVFTIPIKPLSTKDNMKDLKLFRSWVNKKDSVVSIIYARRELPDLGLVVSWKLDADIYWFGANIPGQRISVDTMNMSSVKIFGLNGRPSILP